MAVRILFACGHQAAIREDRSPRCPHCGTTAIDRVLAPAPRFVGVAHGPCATFRDLPAKPVDLVKGTVVPLKKHPGSPLPAFKSEQAQTSAEKGPR